MLTNEDRGQIVMLQKDNARQALREAQVMMDNCFWNAAINRMYYACYYAVSGLMVKNGIETKTHAGIRQMLGLHFIRTGKLSVDAGNIFSNLFSKRQSGDYDAFIYFDRDTAETLYPQAESFIKLIEELIDND
ncbi:MAG: HEPN domain-containing protein [Bacteroidales bacterium]|nr:HEPN domain-containing protein [Bacteroidales bacterium]